MIRTGVRLQCLFNTSVICRSSYLNTHLQQICCLLPLGVGASCSIADAQSLFLHWYRLHLQEEGNTEHDMGNAMNEFEKSVVELQRLGLFLLPHNSNNNNININDGDGLKEREKSKVIHRASTITVELNSIDIDSSHGSEKKNSNENKEVVLFQLLHGVIIPLLYSQLVNSNSNNNNITTTGPSNRIRSSSSSSTISGEEVSVESCLALLEQMRGSSLSSISGGNGNTCRFMGDLVNEVFLTGVRDRVLHPCGNGLYRLHRDVVIHYSHQKSKQEKEKHNNNNNNSDDATTSLLSLQWWWWRYVAPFAKESLRRRVGPDSSCVIASDVWINIIQTRVRQLLQKKDNTIPPPLLIMTKKHTEERVMSFITAAARCWCYSPTVTSIPKWRLQLSDTARVQLAMQTLTSIKSSLARRPAGVQVNELSILVSWPTVAILLRKKSLLKMLSRFPSFFVVVNVQDMHVVQQQLDSSRQGNDLIEEVAAWILEGGGGSGSGSGGESTSHASSFLQDVDIIIRAVTFLRKRQLRQVPTTFTELHGVLVSPSSGTDGDDVLAVLHRYNVVDGISTNNEISWNKYSKKVVQLSSREIQALRTMEMFRKKMCNTVQLYTDAIEPFLLQCYKVVVVVVEEETKKDKGVIMPLSFVERWLQTARLSLKESDIFDILRGCKPPIFLNKETSCICLGNTNEEKKEIPNASSSSSISTVVPSFKKTVPPPLPTPPIPVITHRKDQLYTFDAQLSRVHNALQPDALLHFAETTLHAVFVLLLPHLSVPSGLRLQTLLRRVRWNTVVSTLGTISSFLQAFDGLFFDLFHTFSNDTDDMLVSAYRGPVGAWLLYARLIARLFPPEKDIPLGLVAEGLAWNLRFASRFGDLPSLLRRVGRHCRDGYLLGKIETTSIIDSVGDNNNNNSNNNNNDDIMLWDLLNKIRQQEQELQGEKSIDGQQQFALVKPKLLLQYLQDTKWSEKYNNDNSNSVQLAEKVVRRFPLFFQWQREPTSGETLLRVAFKHSPVTVGLKAFVEEYVCPLLRKHRGIHVEELDNRLGWSRGYFDHHPAGIQAVNGITSCASLFGVLYRYVEVIHPPLLVFEQDTKGEFMHETVVVHPNKKIYQSPEDMLLEVNGLETIVTDSDSDSGSVLLRPLGRPISLFELLAEEKELQESDGVLNISRTEEWRVLLQCEGDTNVQWEKELTQNNGDILVWCGSE